MKKLLSLIVVLMLAAGLCACGGDTGDIGDEDATYEAAEPTTSGMTSFDFMDYDFVGGIYNTEEIELSKELSAVCKSYKFEYQSGNEIIRGFISIPLDCINSQTPSKCIIFNRGGNSELGLLNDSDTARICQATGRVVLASQYRGAGVSSGVDEFGGDDVNDVITLIDICQYNLAFVDMSDLCVAGVSRGGMMSYIVARDDSRVKKIVAVSAVSDLKASYEEREDMRAILDEYIGGSPQDLPAEYANRSAICWPEKIKVPTLMIHSKGDEQVAFSQAEALYAAFEQNGLDCTFKVYDDATHGFHAEDMKLIADWLNG